MGVEHFGEGTTQIMGHVVVNGNVRKHHKWFARKLCTNLLSRPV